MSAAHPLHAEIDLAIARGEWWMRLFDTLSDIGVTRARALSATGGKGLVRAALDYCRLARALCLAIVAAMRLEDFLRGLAKLRTLAPEAIAAARACARARAEEAAAARERARARRAARNAELRQRAADLVGRERDEGEKGDRETPGPRERDTGVEALDRRLAVDPAGVDLDALPLRETVERICADLGVAPDWSRWDAGDWTMGLPSPPIRLDFQAEKRAESPANPGSAGARTASSTRRPTATPTSPIVRGLPGFTPRWTDTAIALVLGAGPDLRPWPPPGLE